MRKLIFALALLFTLPIFSQAPFEALFFVTRDTPPPPGPDVYYDTTTTLNSFFGVGASFIEWDSVTVASGGIATKLRVRARGGLSDQTIKLAIYDNSNNRLGSCETGTIAASSSEAWYEANITIPFAISAGTYKIAIAASGTLEVKTQASTAFGNYSATYNYSNFSSASTLPSADGVASATFVLGVYVD